MAIGIYIHVPFCLRKCRYCDFASYPYQQEQVSLYLKGLKQELRLYGQELKAEHKEITTIFVGGGTPTCLLSGQLSWILEEIDRNFKILPGAEVTTEANPGTVNGQVLAELRRTGFNRISLGVQSTHQELLDLIGRIHSFEQAKQAVELARAVGFDNINLDLIFGLPKQTVVQWQQSLVEVLALQPEHLSCYGLQLEEGTPLCQEVDQGRLEPCSEDAELEMYEVAIETLGAAGYQHYEISNFARAGYQCKHNLLYWHNQHYLGLGPAAHSYLNSQRWGNVENIDAYVKSLAQGQKPIKEINNLTKREQMEEAVFLGLRLLQGLSFGEFEQIYGLPLTEAFAPQIERLLKNGLIEISRGKLRLTPTGLPLANRVFAEFV